MPSNARPRMGTAPALSASTVSAGSEASRAEAAWAETAWAETAGSEVAGKCPGVVKGVAKSNRFSICATRPWSARISRRNSSHSGGRSAYGIVFSPSLGTLAFLPGRQQFHEHVEERERQDHQ